MHLLMKRRGHFDDPTIEHSAKAPFCKNCFFFFQLHSTVKAHFTLEIGASVSVTGAKVPVLCAKILFAVFCLVLLSSALFCSVLFYSVLLCSTLFYSILFYSIPFSFQKQFLFLLLS